MPLDDVKLATEIAKNSVSLADSILGPLFAPNEEARRFFVENVKANTGTLLTIEESTALIQNSRTITREVKNKTKILQRAIEKLKQNSLTIPNVIDEDKAAYFFDKAKNISDTDVQEIWARLLAKELGACGSVHKKLIDILSLMDSEAAYDFTALCRITYQAPGEIKGRKARRLVPFVLPSSSLYDLIWRMEVLPERRISIEHVDNMMYYEIARSSNENLPYKDYCNIVPPFKNLVFLEELGLITLSGDAPRKSNLRNISCTNKESNALFEINEYVCNGVAYRIFCPPNDTKQWDEISASEVLHRADVGYVEYTSIGEQLHQIIEVDILTSLPRLIKSCYESSGYQVVDMVEKASQ